MADPASPPFRVSFSREFGARLRGLGRRAAELGIGDEFLAAVREINRRLTDDPLAWGDPNYRLHHLGLLMCQAIYSFLQVLYAVDEARRLVVIKEIRPLPGHALEENE